MLRTLAVRLRAWWRPGEAHSLGRRGERAAAKFLRKRGYRIVGSGVRSQLGEIDLVAVDGRTVVFVEVKTRHSADHGHPADAVDFEKQKRLTRLALGFLKRHRLLEQPARFDVVAITWLDGQRRPQIEHIQRAFDATGFKGMYS